MQIINSWACVRFHWYIIFFEQAEIFRFTKARVVAQATRLNSFTFLREEKVGNERRNYGKSKCHGSPERSGTVSIFPRGRRQYGWLRVVWQIREFEGGPKIILRSFVSSRPRFEYRSRLNRSRLLSREIAIVRGISLGKKQLLFHARVRRIANDARGTYHTEWTIKINLYELVPVPRENFPRCIFYWCMRQKIRSWKYCPENSETENPELHICSLLLAAITKKLLAQRLLLIVLESFT